MFCHRAACELGRLTAALEGVDALVFTAGIGEHAPAIRQTICEKARWLGVRINSEANRLNQIRLHEDTSSVALYVLPTDEELMIARHVGHIVDLGAAITLDRET